MCGRGGDRPPRNGPSLSSDALAAAVPPLLKTRGGADDDDDDEDARVDAENTSRGCLSWCRYSWYMLWLLRRLMFSLPPLPRLGLNDTGSGGTGNCWWRMDVGDC